jgi:hypothetical protein
MHLMGGKRSPDPDKKHPYARDPTWSARKYECRGRAHKNVVAAESWDARRFGARLSAIDFVAQITLALLLMLLPVPIGVLLVWAARKDGQEDRALQARLGIRRRCDPHFRGVPAGAAAAHRATCRGRSVVQPIGRGGDEDVVFCKRNEALHGVRTVVEPRFVPLVGPHGFPA